MIIETGPVPWFGGFGDWGQGLSISLGLLFPVRTRSEPKILSSDIDLENTMGMPAIFYIIFRWSTVPVDINVSIEILDLFVKAGLDLTKKYFPTGINILHFSALQCKYEIAKFLIDNGMDKTIKSDSGNTALEWSKVQCKEKMEQNEWKPFKKLLG